MMHEVQTYSLTAAVTLAMAGHDAYIAHPDGELDKVTIKQMLCESNEGHLFVVKIKEATYV